MRNTDVVDALNKAIEIFTSHSEKSFEDVMANGIRPIAEAMDLDMVAIYCKSKMNQIGQFYLWNKAAGGTVPINEFFKILPSIPVVTQWRDLILKNESIIRRLDKMSKDEIEFSNMFGIKSIMLVPIFTHGEFWGAVAFQDHAEVRDFDNCREILSSVAYLCANAVIRNETTQNTNALLDNIREQNRQLVSLSKAKDDFLSRISHEIRTPMNAILGIAEIQLQNESLPISTKEGLGMIYNSGDSLLRIVNDLLDLSKIEARKLEITPANYEIASLLCDSVQLNMLQIEDKPIEFRLDIDENTPLKFFGDQLRIKQILNNILSNAFKYTDSGEVSMHVHTERNKSDNSDATIIFRISDSGTGMTAEQIDMLFSTEHSRFDLVSRHLIQGTGLGLAIVWNLLNLMNGKILVESELNKGSVFTVSIPQKAIGDEVLNKEIADNLRKFRISDYLQKKKMRIVHRSMSHGKVLIVDDVASNIYVTKSFLIPYDLSIDSAESGFEAIEKIKSGSVYDIIFMDHMMPKMDGIETTKKLRELGYVKPIVALTANAVTGQEKIFLENGFNGFLTKPIDTRRLNSELNKFIQAKQTRKTVKPSEFNLLQLFAQDAKNALPVFESVLNNIESVSDEDLRLYVVKAHAVKSAFANIGEDAFRERALELETAGKEGNRNIIMQKTPGLIDALNIIIKKSEIRRNLAEKDEDPRYLRKQLEIISNACAKYDIETANNAVDCLKKMSWAKRTEDTIYKISDYILFSDFEEASSLARSYAGKISFG